MPTPPPPPAPPVVSLVEAASKPATAVRLREIGRWESGRTGVSAAEIPAWIGAGGRLGLLVTDAEQGLRRLDASDPGSLRETGVFACVGVNSVAVRGERVAVAAAGDDPAGPGRLIVLEASLEDVAEAGFAEVAEAGFAEVAEAGFAKGAEAGFAEVAEAGFAEVAEAGFAKVAEAGFAKVAEAGFAKVAEAATGVGPDMVLAGPGDAWFTADEGQPAGGVDPAGGLSVVSADGARAAVVRFDAVPAGVRTAAAAGGPQTLEPEYLAASADGSTVFASLQENNAVACFDTAAGAFTDVLDLGLLDRSLPGAGFDGSDRDGGVRIHRWPASAMPQPDAIAVREVGGRTFLLTANEGETREDEGAAGFSDAARVEDLRPDPGFHPEATWLRQPGSLGRLEVVRPGAHPAVDPDGDGDVDRLVAFGGRSLSVFEVLGQPGRRSLAPRWDSGDALERLVAAEAPASFNAGTGDPDSRSGKRGPEPEGLVLGEVGGRTLAFLGLERAHGVVVFDVTDPRRPAVVGSAFAPPAVDRAPEGLAFLPAERSPTGSPLLAVAFEHSGSVVVYAVDAVIADGEARVEGLEAPPPADRTPPTP